MINDLLWIRANNYVIFWLLGYRTLLCNQINLIKQFHVNSNSLKSKMSSYICMYVRIIIPYYCVKKYITWKSRILNSWLNMAIIISTNLPVIRTTKLCIICSTMRSIIDCSRMEWLFSNTVFYNGVQFVIMNFVSISPSSEGNLKQPIAIHIPSSICL